MTTKGDRHRSRDRDATAQQLIEAVGTVLARDGFHALGVNAVAREAGVDKVLIYRYFGGMPQLLRAFGEHGQFWPTDDEVMGGDRDALLALDPGARWARMVTNAVRGIRRRPLTREIFAWETVERNELTEVLYEVREAQFERLMADLGQDVDPDGSLPVVVAISVAATNYLLARARMIRTFAGLDLHSDETWNRFEQTIAALVVAAVEDPDAASRSRSGSS